MTKIMRTSGASGRYLRQRAKQRGGFSRLPAPAVIFLLSAAMTLSAESEVRAAENINSVKIKIYLEEFDSNGAPVLTAEAADDRYEVVEMGPIGGEEAEDGSATGPGRIAGKSEAVISEAVEMVTSGEPKVVVDSQAAEIMTSGEPEALSPDKVLISAAVKEQHVPESTPLPMSYEIALSSVNGAVFGKMEQKDIRIAGIEGTCVRAVRRNSGTELILTAVMTGISQLVGEIESAQFMSDCRAEWSAAANSSLYEILLYYGESRVGFPHRTQGTAYDLAPLMKKEGYYSFKVYPLSQAGKKGGAVRSGIYKVDSETAKRNRENYPYPVEGEERIGCFLADGQYRYGDGMYPQCAWIHIDENHYFFDQDGHLEKHEISQ